MAVPGRSGHLRMTEQLGDLVDADLLIDTVRGERVTQIVDPDLRQLFSGRVRHWGTASSAP